MLQRSIQHYILYFEMKLQYFVNSNSINSNVEPCMLFLHQAFIRTIHTRTFRRFSRKQFPLCVIKYCNSRRITIVANIDLKDIRVKAIHPYYVFKIQAIVLGIRYIHIICVTSQHLWFATELFKRGAHTPFLLSQNHRQKNYKSGSRQLMMPCFVFLRYITVCLKYEKCSRLKLIITDSINMEMVA